MFGWFSAKCPVSLQDRTWTEEFMRWLADQFGVETLRTVQVLLPIERDFSEPFTASADDARRYFDRICGIYRIDPQAVQLEIVDAVLLPTAAGHYDSQECKRPVIRVADKHLQDPLFLFMVLAHELVHQLLLGEKRLTIEFDDHELVTDLTLVFFGLGVFIANTAVREVQYEWGKGTTKSGYLDQPRIGYALALFAWHRGETKPEWLSHLPLTIRNVCGEGLLYLRKSDESLFHPQKYRPDEKDPTFAEWLEQAHRGNPSERLLAFWWLWTFGEEMSREVEFLGQTLNDDESAIREAVINVVGSLPKPAYQPLLPALVAALDDYSPKVRLAAIQALSHLRQWTDEFLDKLFELLNDSDREVSTAAIQNISGFGLKAEPARKAIFQILRMSLAKAKYEIARECLLTLPQILSDPDQQISEALDGEPDLLRLAKSLAAEDVKRII